MVKRLEHDRLTVRRDRKADYFWPHGDSSSPWEELICLYLIPWLNENRRGAPADRIRKLLELSGMACDLTRPIKEEESGNNYPTRPIVKRLAEELTKRLARYRGTRVTFLDYKVNAPWRSIGGDAGSKAHEFFLANVIMDAAERDLLQRVRQCECDKYFFARSSLTRFCSTACRVEYWEASEQRKEQKRAKAREYYWLHKNKNMK